MNIATSTETRTTGDYHSHLQKKIIIIQHIPQIKQTAVIIILVISKNFKFHFFVYMHSNFDTYYKQYPYTSETDRIETKIAMIEITLKNPYTERC